MVSQEEFLKLLEKFTVGNISAEEHEVLFYCIQSGRFDDMLSDNILNNLKEDNNVSSGLPANRSEEIIRKIESAEKQTELLIPGKTNKTRQLIWPAAAVFFAAIALFIFFLPSKKNQYVFKQAAEDNMVEQVNSANKPLLVELEDGSTINLKPQSRITYPETFLKNKREVYLEGAAFFSVTKNAGRPFYVYSKNIVTHVLGTSFNVKAYAANRQLEVAVITGRVEVYEKHRRGEISDDNNGVVLLPNHKVVYNEDDHQFIPGLVDVPLPLAKTALPESAKNLVFEEEKLLNVLTLIEKTYGIEIEVENDNINNCLFTGDISKQDLYTKLDIISQSINATYETKGTKILIRGKGCG